SGNLASQPLQHLRQQAPAVPQGAGPIHCQGGSVPDVFPQPRGKGAPPRLGTGGTVRRASVLADAPVRLLFGQCGGRTAARRQGGGTTGGDGLERPGDRKSTRLNSSHVKISY